MKNIGLDLSKTDLRKDDIDRLITLKEITSEKKFDYLRKQVMSGRENLAGISHQFFKSSKYVQKNTNSASLITVLEKMLGVNKFAKNSDEKYLNPISCSHPNPKISIICENFYFLRFPHLIQENPIELIYFGGRNLSKLKNKPDVNLPTYYIGDWDKDGLEMYESAKKIMEEVHERELVLITPHGDAHGIEETIEFHSSQWRNSQKPFEGLTESFYTEEQKKIIRDLVQQNKWIEEEGNDLEAILQEIL